MDAWMYEQMDGWTGWMDRWMMHGWMDTWMYEQMDGWMDGWRVNGKIDKKSPSF
jgi:hypothetical protein